MQYIILFDLDGTLIDSTQAVYEGFCTAFRHFDAPIPAYEDVYSAPMKPEEF